MACVSKIPGGLVFPEDLLQGDAPTSELTSQLAHLGNSPARSAGVMLTHGAQLRDRFPMLGDDEPLPKSDPLEQFSQVSLCRVRANLAHDSLTPILVETDQSRPDYHACFRATRDPVRHRRQNDNRAGCAAPSP